MRISDWSSDVCSSDLRTFLCPVRRPLWSAIFVEEFGQPFHHGAAKLLGVHDRHRIAIIAGDVMTDAERDQFHRRAVPYRSEEHTSELQSLMRISYAVFCLKTKTFMPYTQLQYINISSLHRAAII